MSTQNLEQRVEALEQIFSEMRCHLSELHTLRRRGGDVNVRTLEHYLDLIIKSIDKRLDSDTAHRDIE